jgi:hypothetical protein
MKKLHICLAQVLLAAYLLISAPAEVSASQNGSAQRGPAAIEAKCQRPRQGPTGFTGATGAPGEILAYIAGYADGTIGPFGTIGPSGATGDVPLDLQVVDIGDPILFNVPGPMSGIFYNGNIGPLAGTFSVDTSGIYKIDYGASFVGTLPYTGVFHVPVIGLRLGTGIDSVEIPDSYIAGYAHGMFFTMGGISLGDWASGSVILSITDSGSQIISLINSNMASATPLQLVDLAQQLYSGISPPPFPPTTTSAFITIERIQ